jgi:phage terminase small subunit
VADEAEKSKPLTLKQRQFVDAYVGQARGNATEAARIAGYSDPEQSGWQNKKKVDISAAIEAELKLRTLGADEVLERLTQHAQGTLRHFVYLSGDNVTVDLGTEDALAHLHLLKKIKTKRKTGGKEDDRWEEIETEIELHDPQAALVHLGRYHKLFTDRQEIGGTNGGPILITAIEAVRPAPRPDGDSS